MTNYAIDFATRVFTLICGEQTREEKQDLSMLLPIFGAIVAVRMDANQAAELINREKDQRLKACPAFCARRPQGDLDHVVDHPPPLGPRWR